MSIINLLGNTLLFTFYYLFFSEGHPTLFTLIVLPILGKATISMLKFLDRNNLKENKKFQKSYQNDEFRGAVIIQRSRLIWCNSTAKKVGVDQHFMKHYRSIRPVDVENSRFFYKSMYFNTKYDVLNKTVRILFYSPNGQNVQDYFKENSITPKSKSNLVAAVERCFTLNSYLLKQNGRRIDIDLQDTPIFTNLEQDELVQFISPIFKIIHFYSKVAKEHKVKISYFTKPNLAGLTIRFDKSHSLKLMNLLIPNGTEKNTVRQMLSQMQRANTRFNPKIYVEEAELSSTVRFEFIRSQQVVKVSNPKIKLQQEQNMRRDFARKRSLFSA